MRIGCGLYAYCTVGGAESLYIGEVDGTTGKGDSAMTEDSLSAAISPAEVELFKERNPNFGLALGRLEEALRRTFLREMKPAPGKPADQHFVVFFLSHQAIEEFFDIVQLAVHG